MMNQRFELRKELVASINMLNDDILLKIFDYIHLDDKIKLRRTCTRWKILLDYQLKLIKALRVGYFQQGGYNVTSGLNMQCEHSNCSLLHRKHTGTLFNHNILNFPADLETQCFSVKRYDFLHRAMKYCHESITILSLGQIGISYRLLMVITHNLPNLEHLELIHCASDNNETRKRKFSTKSNSNDHLPSLESFNTEQQDDIHLMTIPNQHQDEEMNMRERLIRSSLVRSCDLVKEAKANSHWPNLRHLLIKECNLLSEFSLSLILAITSHTLVHLVIESNQYLTGEFLNYCGPNLKILRLRYCPLIQVKFLQDFVKIKQLLAQTPTSHPPSSFPSLTHNSKRVLPNPPHYHHLPSPQPINSSMFENFRNFNQDIYCML